jgi:Glycosyltransferases involved in cell wall biogenesis
MAKVSVIVPVYNVRDYIVTCIDSLIFQTLEDIEIIFVDDHGDDDSIAVAQKYLGEYIGEKRFRFTETPENSGPATARNIGISEATGDYVAFLDSDDWLEPSFCKTLYDLARKNDADLVCCDISLDTCTDGESQIKKNPNVKNGEFTRTRKCKFLTEFTSYFTTFIYRREFLKHNDIRFPDTRSSEDSCFLSCCLLAAARIASVHQPLYHYMLRGNSLSLSKNDTRHLQKLESFGKVMDFAKSRELYGEYQDEIDFIYIKKAFLVSVFTYMKNSADPKKDDVVAIYEEMKKRIPNYKENKYFHRKAKIRTLTSMIEKTPRVAMKVISSYVKKSDKML